MKDPILTYVLPGMVGLLLVAGAATTLIALRTFFSTRELQRIQNQIVTIDNTLAAAQGLANDALVFSRSHPDLEPILQPFLRQGGTNAAAQSTNTPAQPVR